MLLLVTYVTHVEGALAIPDLVKRDFNADRPGIKFVGDITYSAQSVVMRSCA